MPCKRIRELEPVRIPPPHERLLRTVYSPEQDPDLAGDFTMFHLTILPHSSSDRHAHAASGEVMYVIAGSGEGLLGDEVYALEVNSAFYAPPGVSHQVRNTTDGEMQLICLFAPAVGTAYARGKAAESR